MNCWKPFYQEGVYHEDLEVLLNMSSLTSSIVFRSPLQPHVLRGRSSAQMFSSFQSATLPSPESRYRSIRVHAEASSNAETSFKSTVELDRLIDTLRDTDQENLTKVIAENVFSFDSNFWLRLAARSELCNSEDDKMDYEELASDIMTTVEQIVKKTQEKIESATDVLKSILRPLILSNEEIQWPPSDPQMIVDMKQELERREREGYLDEIFLSEVSAQLRQATKDEDKPGLVAILQTVLQFYAAGILSKRSYASKDGVINKAEELLETIISAEETSWESLLRTKLDVGGGQVTSEDFLVAVSKRIERTLLRTESGSYQQRVIVEYLKEIQNRATSLIEAFKSSPPT